MKVKLTGIELTTTKGQKVKLTLKEAEELYNELDKLFGKPSPTPHIPWHPFEQKAGMISGTLLSLQ